MKVVMLDIDGVLCNSAQWHDAHVNHETGRSSVGFHHFDKGCVKLLNEFVEKNNAKFVISSTWRTFGLDKLRIHFKEEGVTGEIIDRTDDLWQRGVNTQRGEEIQEWLDRHNDIEAFVVFDDNSDMKGVEPNFVQTLWIDPENGELIEGLRDNHIVKAQAVLDKPLDKVKQA